MNTEFIRGFLETANTGSIAKASERLHITHTALSKQLRMLEQQFDVQLFVRSPQGVELTEAGRVCYESSARLLELVSEITSSLEPYRKKRKLRIGAVPDLATRYVTTSLHNFIENGYEIELVCRTSTKEVYQLLQSGDADLLVAEETAMHPSVWIGELQQEPLLVVVPKGHPFSRRERVTLSELSEEPLVLYSEGCTVRAKVKELFEAEQRPLHIKTEVGFHEVILGYVASGSGLTVLPETVVLPLANEQLTTVSLDHPDAKRTISVFSKDRARGARVLQLLR